MRFVFACCCLLASTAPAPAQPRIPTPQDIEELNKRRDPPPTEEYRLARKRRELCREQHPADAEAFKRCLNKNG